MGFLTTTIHSGRRERKPLTIQDPVTKEAVVLPTPAPPVNVSSISTEPRPAEPTTDSAAANEKPTKEADTTQIQANFRCDFAKLLAGPAQSTEKVNSQKIYLFVVRIIAFSRWIDHSRVLVYQYLKNEPVPRQRNWNWLILFPHHHQLLIVNFRSQSKIHSQCFLSNRKFLVKLPLRMNRFHQSITPTAKLINVILRLKVQLAPNQR